MNQLLDITAKCKGNDLCIYRGQDLFLEIRITNNQKTEIGFPLVYLQKTGPIIKLVDTRTRVDTNIKTNLGDFTLREKFTKILPGQSILLEWVLMSSELEQFGSKVDVSAEITVMAEVQVNGAIKEFFGTTTLRITEQQGTERGQT